MASVPFHGRLLVVRVLKHVLVIIGCVLVASACSSNDAAEPSGEAEPTGVAQASVAGEIGTVAELDAAAFCSALTTPMDFEPVQVLDVAPESGDQSVSAAGLAVVREDADEVAVVDLSARMAGHVPDRLASWQYSDRQASGETLDLLGEKIDEFALLAAVLDSSDIPRYFVFEANVERRDDFIALVEELRSDPLIAEVRASTDRQRLAGETVSVMPVTLFELLAGSVLAPRVLVFMDSDATEVEISNFESSLDEMPATYWWFDQQRALTELERMVPDETIALSADDLPPSFRIEVAGTGDPVVITDSLDEDEPGVFDVTSISDAQIERMHDSGLVLLARPTAQAMLERLRAASGSELAPKIDTLAVFVSLRWATATPDRGLAYSAAAAVRDQAVDVCGIDPCVRDRGGPIATLTNDIDAALRSGG